MSAEATIDRAPGGRLADGRRDVGAGAQVDAPERLVEQQHPGAVDEPASRRPPSAGCRPTASDTGASGSARDDPHARDGRLAAARARAACPGAGTARCRAGTAALTFAGDRPVAEDRLRRPLLGHEVDAPQRRRSAGSRGRYATAVEGDRPPASGGPRTGPRAGPSCRRPTSPNTPTTSLARTVEVDGGSAARARPDSRGRRRPVVGRVVGRCRRRRWSARGPASPGRSARPRTAAPWCAPGGRRAGRSRGGPVRRPLPVDGRCRAP